MAAYANDPYNLGMKASIMMKFAPENGWTDLTTFSVLRNLKPEEELVYKCAVLSGRGFGVLHRLSRQFFCCC